MKRIMLCGLLLLLLSGCGMLSNQPYWSIGGFRGQVVYASQPLQNALVFVRGESQTTTSTDAGGYFEISGLSGNRKTLVVVWGDSLGLQREFDLTGQEMIDLGTLEVQPIGLVIGTVNNSDPRQVQVSVEGTPFVSHPDAAGRFHLLLPGGRWDLKLQAEGYLDKLVSGLQLEGGKTKQLETISLPVDTGHTCQDGTSRTDLFSQGGGGAIDVLFIVDNSGSMVGEQQALASSFGYFVEALDRAAVDYHVAVITTGMLSEGCPPCDSQITLSCMNETGESGRFQDRLGHNQGTVDEPDFVFFSEPTCRLVTSDNLDCFYEQAGDRGTVLVGVNGCGYERGLAAMRTALGTLADTDNAGFLREWARLAVVVVSDEEDCGEVGDVSESPEAGGNVCYYASKGVDPEGASEDPSGKQYVLTPVAEYAAFLQGLKAVPALVSFSAIVGMSDPEDPTSTEIEYQWSDPSQRWEIVPACTAPDCAARCDQNSPSYQRCLSFCQALPGTRYLALAQLMNGTTATICQEDFSQPLLDIVGVSVGYRRKFKLSAAPLSDDSIAVTIDQKNFSTGYYYDPQQRSVIFEPGTTPPPYSLVKIDYQAACP